MPERAHAVRATVVGEPGRDPVQVVDGQQVTFGRDPSADVRLAGEGSLSRLAGSVRALSAGVAITNLSATHDLFVRSDTAPGTVRLSATEAGTPVASLLVNGGTSTITWPGAGPGAAVTVTVTAVPQNVPTRPDAGRTTAQPLALNPRTKEFAVALLLCRPRLEAVPGRVSTPTVPVLTRQILEAVHSFRLLAEFDDKNSPTKARMTARIHEHLKGLRDKLVRNRLATDGTGLSPEAVADLLVDHNVIRPRHLTLLTDDEWLTVQEREWEQ